MRFILLSKSIMPTFLLFCKSYTGDLKRIQRMWLSVQRFNRDQTLKHLIGITFDINPHGGAFLVSVFLRQK